MACRVNYTSMWTLRLLYELDNWSSATFLTLTYDDEHLPIDRGLHPEDLQKFWKRLRRRLEHKIKYYAVGEYGSLTKRCHFHAIVFGLDCYSTEDRQAVIDSWTNCESFMFTKDNKSFAPVTREDIQYVTGYVQKKLSGDEATLQYGSLIRPFSRCSRGLGLDFALKHKERLIDNGFTYLNGKRIFIPRYFRDKFGVIASDLLKKEVYSDIEVLKKGSEELYSHFVDDMIRHGTYYPDNLTMMSNRFERWLENFDYTYSKQVEKDFHQRSKLRGKI